jgi:RNA polymerase sigma-70 factor (ECF subfamily)
MASPGIPATELRDHTLLARFGRSDREASSLFFSRFYGRVFGLANAIVADRRAAEDVAQEAFVRAWRNADAFDARRGTVLNWLLTITRNVAIDSVRVRRPIPVDPDAILEPPATIEARDPADAVMQRDRAARLRRAISQLPTSQRRAVVLAGLYGFSASEVAEAEQIPLGTAKSRIRIALRRLRTTELRDGFDCYTSAR